MNCVYVELYFNKQVILFHIHFEDMMDSFGQWWAMVALVFSIRCWERVHEGSALVLGRQSGGARKLWKEKNTVEYPYCPTLFLDSVGTQSCFASLKTAPAPIIFHKNRDFINHEFRFLTKLGLSCR